MHATNFLQSYIQIAHAHTHTQTGLDESHTIHKLRATTVIFEEGNSFDDNDFGPVIANIVLPNRPHSTALRVEEVGSFKLETEPLTSPNTTTTTNATYQQLHGIIDEIDSDADGGSNVSYRRAISRNVSIVSASEDENSIASGTAAAVSARDVTVDEYSRNVQLDAEHTAHIKFIKTVIEEQEIITDDDERPVAAELKPAQLSNTSVETIVLPKAEQASLFEKAEATELSEDERKQMRIKEIRSNARKASLIWKEEASAVDNKIEPNAEQIGSEQLPCSPRNAKLINVENATEKSMSAAEKMSSVETKPMEQLNCDVDDGDAEMADLMKRVQRQRSALNEIMKNAETEHVGAIIQLDNTIIPGTHIIKSKKNIIISNPWHTKLINSF